MYLKTLHITAFGGLRDKDIELSDGVNVIGGQNEAGKTSAAMFIKFIFYGLSSKAAKTEGASERARFINRETSQAAGYIIAETDDGAEYRLERTLTASDGATPRERVRIINQSTGETVTGQNPGEYFFGAPESVFVSTVFVSQNRPLKPEISGDGGRGGSVENLLTSADESVDIKRAVKKLDLVRRELCHKKGAGGEISELRSRRAELAAERAQVAGKAAEILSATASLNDINGNISVREAESEGYAKIFSSLAKIETKRKFDALDGTAHSIADINRSVKLIDSSPVGGSFAEELLAAERDIREYDEQNRAYAEKLPSYPEGDDDLDIPNADDVIAEVTSSAKKTRVLFAAAIALLMCGALAAAAVVVMYFLSMGAFLLPLGTAVIFAALGIAVLIVRRGENSRLGEMLEYWGAESADEIETAVYDSVDGMERTQALIEEKRELEEALGAARVKRDEADGKLRALAKSVNADETADTYELIKLLHSLADTAREERESLVVKASKLKGRLEILSEQLDGEDREEVFREAAEALSSDEGRLAAALTPDGVKELAKKKEFNETALRSAIKRKEGLDERLAELGKLNRTPDELETMINTLTERIDELSLRHDACSLAQDALLRAGEAMRSGVIPRISTRASEIIADCTGRYSRLTVDNAFSCGLGDGSDTKTSEFFSRGTGDLAYIALRIALAEEVFRAEEPTLIYDESFAHVDSDRIKNVLLMLEKGRGQDIVFTCRREETDIARSLGCNVISL